MCNCHRDQGQHGLFLKRIAKLSHESCTDDTVSGCQNTAHQSVPYFRQVRDFLQRVKCGRFPPIEKDMKMVAAHCGSLFLDPAALSQVPLASPQLVCHW